MIDKIEGKYIFCGAETPVSKEEDNFIEKMIFTNNGKDEIVEELCYKRVDAKKVILQDIINFGFFTNISNFLELCHDVAVMITLDSSLLEKAVLYNLWYLVDRVHDPFENYTNGLDISEAFNKEYYDENLTISSDNLKAKMLQYFNILSENDSEIILTFKNADKNQQKVAAESFQES